jgi:hypothetical protein
MFIDVVNNMNNKNSIFLLNISVNAYLILLSNFVRIEKVKKARIRNISAI